MASHPWGCQVSIINDKNLQRLAMVEIISPGTAGAAASGILIGAFLIGAAWLLKAFYWDLPKAAINRGIRLVGRFYYRALGISPKTLERIKRHHLKRLELPSLPQYPARPKT